MKRKNTVPLLVVAAIVFSGCGNAAPKEDTPKQAAQEKTAENKEAEKKSIEVQENLLSVEITIPASLVGKNIDNAVENAKKKGVSDVKKNDDGSLTYKMSKRKHKEMLDEMKAEIVKQVDEVKDGTTFKSVKNVEYNNDLTEFTITVDEKAFSKSMDGMAGMGLGLTSRFYQIMSGVKPGEDKAVIQYKDSDSGKVIKTVTYPAK
ncbi:hypothetical protein AV654_33285 [Paenibacillus elgii]|uniref:Antigen I/II N-terminal domain-containing protein n=1 Tax=Paenibacillus elgii TaxID=189691 RepID=A0A165PUX2_9BACL|nr:hypothetical protein [Paenibacillus elgii]KZE72642.1 hypothetical protein AV654_33285 [Paenibacillus elgii]